MHRLVLKANNDNDNYSGETSIRCAAQPGKLSLNKAHDRRKHVSLVQRKASVGVLALAN